MELHFNQALKNEVVVQFSNAVTAEGIVNEQARAEGERCFTAFRDKYPDPEIFGKVLATEFDIKSTAEVADAVGICPFTARVDLVTELSKSSSSALHGMFSVDGAVGYLKEGVWLIDHKFYGRRAANMLDKSLNSLQFTAYMLAYHAFTGVKPRGMLQNTVFTTKYPDFRLTVVPYPSEDKIKALQNVFLQVKRIMDNARNAAIPTDNNCFGWGSVCKWLITGECRRY
jgi:hypothetical protein